MEELQNGEFLEKEILDDARKKAERTLRAAEKEVEKLEREWQLRIDAAGAEIEARFDGLKKHALNQVRDSIPLERKRLRLAHSEERFNLYLDAFFREIDQEYLSGLLTRGLESRRSAFAGMNVRARFSGLDEKAARNIVENGLGGPTLVDCVNDPVLPRGLIVSSEDGLVSCRLTVQELKSSLQSRQRAELGKLLAASGGGEA